MAFDMKGVFASQAFAVAGGVVIGAGIFTLISATITSFVQPLFNVVFERGMIELSDRNGIYWNCGAFLGAALIAVICVALGFVMVKSAGK